MVGLIRNLGLVVVAASLLGCNNEKVRGLLDQRAAEARQGVNEAQQPAVRKSYNPLQVSEKVWAGSSSTRLRRGLPLPARFETAKGITIVLSEPANVVDIASMLSSQTGIPLRVNSDVQSGGKNTNAAAALVNATMPLAYEGPLSGLLDQICGYYGVNWRYDGSSINISRYETRVFMIESLPGTQSVKDGVKEASASSSSSSGTGGTTTAASNNDLQQTTEMKIDLKAWDELGQTLTALLGGVGSAVVSPSSGTITVTTTPDIMRNVAKYVAEENKRLSRQIAINVEVYSVSLSEGTDFNVAFNTALKKLSDFGMNYTSLTRTPVIQGGGALNLAILNPGETGQVTSIFTAISQMGDASRVAQFPMTTLNNRPVSRRIGKDHVYAASVSNSNTTNYTSTAITPGTVQEGFSLQVTPRLLDDGRIMLQYSISLVDLVNLTTFTSSGSSIQLPETSTRVFVQQSMLKSGSTLIIGGYDDEQASQQATGVGSPFNFLLGGGSNNSTSRAMLFIAITPQVLDVSQGEQE